MQRRHALGAAVTGLATAGCASTTAGSASPFTVAQPVVPIAGSTEVFPVRRIYCIGRNYAAHAREMGSDPTREPPFFFQKPSDAVQFVAPGQTTDHPYPPLTRNYHYELELVAALHKGGRNMPVDKALDLVYGYAVGLDMTRRDLQAEAKAAGRPWDTAKGFDQSAILGEIVRVADVGYLERGAITLAVNGSTKQQGDLADMIWNPAEIVSNLSHLYRLHPGDLIYTGTPAGVGAVLPGDVLTGRIDAVGEIQLTVGQPE